MKDVYFPKDSERRGAVARDGVVVDLAAEDKEIERLLAIEEQQ